MKRVVVTGIGAVSPVGNSAEETWQALVSGQNGKARFCPIRIPNPSYTPDNGQPKTLSNSCTACPYNNKFNLLKGKTCFSTLSVTDKDGNTDSYEPVQCPPVTSTILTTTRNYSPDGSATFKRTTPIITDIQN